MLPISSKRKSCDTVFVGTVYNNVRNLRNRTYAYKCRCIFQLVRTSGDTVFNQLGGLGFMTILCIVFIVSNRQIGLRNRMLIAQTSGYESLEGIVKLAKHVLYITGIIELSGAIVLSIRFVPKYGFFKGMWFSIISFRIGYFAMRDLI